MPTTQNAQAQDGLPYHQDVGEKAQDNVLRFLREWIDMEHETAPSQEDASPGPYYARVLKEMREKDQPTMSINYDHISQWSIDVAETIKENFLIVEPYLRKAVRQFVSEQDPEFLKDNNREREFYISIVGLPVSERLRDLRTEKVGKLVAFKGTVTRTSEVRPELYQGAFRCGATQRHRRSAVQRLTLIWRHFCKHTLCGCTGPPDGGKPPPISSLCDRAHRANPFRSITASEEPHGTLACRHASGTVFAPIQCVLGVRCIIYHSRRAGAWNAARS